MCYIRFSRTKRIYFGTTIEIERIRALSIKILCIFPLFRSILEKTNYYAFGWNYYPSGSRNNRPIDSNLYLYILSSIFGTHFSWSLTTVLGCMRHCPTVLTRSLSKLCCSWTGFRSSLVPVFCSLWFR